MEEKFRIRSYGFGELAQLYFPNISKNSASWQLTIWINQSKLLKKELENSGKKKGQKILSPKHVELIIKEFGEP
jgi:hypothetical protein